VYILIDMWKEYDIKGTARWRIGGLELWARNRGEDIDIAREASAFDPAKEFQIRIPQRKQSLRRA
jgi:hypothetical protein